jgi:predicted nucleic acid-binding protein
MKVECFLDTNVLIYAVAGKDDAPQKHDRAIALLEKGAFGVSGQVLQEFFVIAIRKPSVPLSPDAAFLWVERLSLQPCVAVDSSLVKLGIAISQRYRIDYWDGAILAAAEALSAETLYTEDLNHGQMYGSVRVVNPFR